MAIDSSRTNKTLQELGDALEKIKRDMAAKEGARDQVLENIKKEFGVSSIDEAYALHKKMDSEIEVRRERFEMLLQQAQKKLEGYKG